MTFGEVNGTRNVPLGVRGHAGNRRSGADPAQPLYFLLRAPLGRCKHYIDKVHIWAFGS